MATELMNKFKLILGFAFLALAGGVIAQGLKSSGVLESTPKDAEISMLLEPE